MLYRHVFTVMFIAIVCYIRFRRDASANCMGNVPTYELDAHQILRVVTGDMHRSARNVALRQMRKEYKTAGARPGAAGTYEGVSVLPAHLRGARNEADVLRKMIAGRHKGEAAKNPTGTRLLYASMQTLEQALKIARDYHDGRR